MNAGTSMLGALGRDAGRGRCGRAALLALALQVRSAWLLLGVWVVSGTAATQPLLGRVRMLPAHPDWYLPALVQSVVAALTMVGLAGRWRSGWVVAAAAAASGVAWAATFAWVPNGLGGYLLVVQPVQEALAMAVLLACLAVTWRRLDRWAAVPVVALTGGFGVGALRLLLSNTILSASWPEGWPRELAYEVFGVALLAVVVAVLRGMTDAGQDGGAGTPGWRSGATLGTAGLLVLTVAHLAAGSFYSGWSLSDSHRLLVAAGALALLFVGALVSSVRASHRKQE